MTFQEACVEAAEMAANNGKLYYVYRTTKGGFMTSHQYDSDWLFKAYPGGRKILSVEGNKLTR